MSSVICRRALAHLISQPRSLVLDGCPMFASAYMGRKRIPSNAFTRPVATLALGRSPFCPSNKTGGRGCAPSFSAHVRPGEHGAPVQGIGRRSLHASLYDRLSGRILASRPYSSCGINHAISPAPGPRAGHMPGTPREAYRAQAGKGPGAQQKRSTIDHLSLPYRGASQDEPGRAATPVASPGYGRELPSCRALSLRGCARSSPRCAGPPLFPDCCGPW